MQNTFTFYFRCTLGEKRGRGMRTGRMKRKRRM